MIFSNFISYRNTGCWAHHTRNSRYLSWAPWLWQDSCDCKTAQMLKRWIKPQKVAFPHLIHLTVSGLDWPTGKSILFIINLAFCVPWVTTERKVVRVVSNSRHARLINFSCAEKCAVDTNSSQHRTLYSTKLIDWCLRILNTNYDRDDLGYLHHSLVREILFYKELGHDSLFLQFWYLE